MIGGHIVPPEERKSPAVTAGRMSNWGCLHDGLPLSPSASSDDRQTQPDPLDDPPTLVTLASPAEPELRPRTFIAALATLAATACAVLAFALYQAATVDPYTQAVLVLDGDPGQGGRLFRINCAGCHGLAAQGLVGPNLHGVTDRKNDSQLVQQVISGKTPPMPKFELDPQDMADLISLLHHLETQPTPAVP